MFTVLTNKKIAQNVYEMTLAGDTSGIKNAGQFVNVKIDGLFLRRPISVCDYGENFLKIIYKVVGRGTEKMSAMSAGQPLDILTGLGNGYDLSAAGDKPLLIGGGVGVPPLYNLAKKLLAAGKRFPSFSVSIPKAKYFTKRNSARSAPTLPSPRRTAATG